MPEARNAPAGGAARLIKEEVDEEDIAEVVARWTGVPVSRLMEGEVQKLSHLEEQLHKRVIGQEVSYRFIFPDAELKKYYDEHPTEFVRKEQVYLSQILLSAEGKTPEQVATLEAKAKDIVARARNAASARDSSPASFRLWAI